MLSGLRSVLIVLVCDCVFVCLCARVNVVAMFVYVRLCLVCDLHREAVCFVFVFCCMIVCCVRCSSVAVCFVRDLLCDVVWFVFCVCLSLCVRLNVVHCVMLYGPCYLFVCVCMCLCVCFEFSVFVWFVCELLCGVA